MNKRANFGDIIYLIVAICVIGIIFVVCWKILSAVNDQAQAGDLIAPQGKTMMQSLTNRYVAINDAAFLMLFVGLIVAIGVGSYFIYTHPALIWVGIPIMVFLVFLAAIFGNVMYGFFHSSEMSSEFSDFRILSFVFDHFVFVFATIILIITTLLFIKPSSPEPQ